MQDRMDCTAVVHSLDTDIADANSHSVRKLSTIPNASRSNGEREEAGRKKTAADEEDTVAEDAKPTAGEGGDEPDMHAAEGQQWRKERGQVCKYTTGNINIELGRFAQHALAS